MSKLAKEAKRAARIGTRDFLDEESVQLRDPVGDVVEPLAIRQTTSQNCGHGVFDPVLKLVEAAETCLNVMRRRKS